MAPWFQLAAARTPQSFERGILTVEAFNLGHRSNVTSTKRMGRSRKEQDDSNGQHCRRYAQGRHGDGVSVVPVRWDNGGRDLEGKRKAVMEPLMKLFLTKGQVSQWVAVLVL